MVKLIFILFLAMATTHASAQSLDDVIKFIKDNPKKASIVLIENGKETLHFSGNQIMPLASAAKTIIAVEFSNQAAAKKLNPDQNIAISELNKYYIPFTDGGAHTEWLKSLKKKKGDSVSLLQIAKGMIQFSSNANTEYLEDLLGLANINHNIKTLKLQQHSLYFYFTAAALMTCLKPENIDESKWAALLEAMPVDEYRKRCEANHLKLKADSTFIKTFNFKNLSMKLQKIWSDRLVASTAADYANLMQKVNSRSYFKTEVQSILDQIMEWPMVFPANQQAFKHLGQKGGSTAFIITDAFYATDQKEAKVACAFFFNNLTEKENTMINHNFGGFEASIITDTAFRKKLITALL
ncbi:D-alanyl-D-alanine carboxypeptidase [Pedobacter petrophilus]|uniref:beta-lactamase n=1 Tax=Pedobacter petrophilus TaxID=1908241 RepID=A0A7K0G157_9SPHI|nr:serine hydrolase [Pedobacter petrophilus]MRX77515.1 D-alanyl-D-alanine carboxypeptidase [Pedobacter petrophilus]